ncbi:hypothetical protein ILUMI_18514, partial [Ignelater luminosus]
MTTFMIGSLRSFHETKEDINGYLLRLEHYLKVSNVESTYRVSVLLATVDLKLVSLLQDLCSPVEVDEKTYQELTDILVNHLKPARLIIDERFKFNARVHQQEESISEFVVALKHLAKTCNFGTFSKDSLRDRLVGGIKDSHIQQRLRAAESDFDETSKKALMLEEASKNAILLTAGTVDQDVVNLKKKFKSVFDLHRRKILGHEVKLVFRDENVTPSFCKARPVPYAIKDAVEKELKRLVNSGVLKPVTCSEWASPVVVVSKPDDSIRKLVPLYKLTKEGKQCEWSKECKTIYKDSKTLICSSDVLALYDPIKKLRLTCDSSCYGVGAVLSHVINAEEKSISFASKTVFGREELCPNRERSSCY